MLGEKTRCMHESALRKIYFMNSGNLIAYICLILICVLWRMRHFFFFSIYFGLMRHQQNLWRAVCPELSRTVGKLLKVQQIVSILFMARGSGKAGISGVFGAADRPVTHAARSRKKCVRKISLNQKQRVSYVKVPQF